MSVALASLDCAPCAAPRVYRRRRPERTALYRLIQQHLETWLARAREADPDGAAIPRHIERELRGSDAGFKRFRRATQTPFNLVYEARA